MDSKTAGDFTQVRDTAKAVVAEHAGEGIARRDLLGACFDAGLTWVHFPVGLGGLGLPRAAQSAADEVFREARVVTTSSVNPIGYGMVAPTLRVHADPEVARELLRPMATGEHVWCQLFSEPSAGSDLAGLASSAVRDGDQWVVNGQKVWTSLAHLARWGLLLARTDPDVPKHQGMTAFAVDMTAPGVRARPLRQMTGDAEFNEVRLVDVRVPDRYRVGPAGAGWQVARTTLMNERTSIGDGPMLGGSGRIRQAIAVWNCHPERHTPVLRDRLAALWIAAEGHRLTGSRTRRAARTTDAPGAEGTLAKVNGAELNQRVYEFCLDVLGPEAALYGSYSSAGESDDCAVQRAFLRSRANTIEGGTSDVLRNVVGERLLGLPGDLRADVGRSWREVSRG